MTVYIVARVYDVAEEVESRGPGVLALLGMELQAEAREEKLDEAVAVEHIRS